MCGCHGSPSLSGSSPTSHLLAGSLPDRPPPALPGPAALQPTVFCSVPRVFERFESTAMDKVSLPSQDLVFDFCQLPAVSRHSASLLEPPSRCTRRSLQIARAGRVKRFVFQLAFRLKLAAIKVGGIWEKVRQWRAPSRVACGW